MNHLKRCVEKGMAPLRYPTCLLLSCLSLSLCSTLLYIYYSILYSLLLTIDDIVTLYIYTVYHVIAIFVFFAGYSFIWQTFNLYHPHSTKCRCRSDAALDPQEKNGHGVRGGYPLVNVYKELSNMAQSK